MDFSCVLCSYVYTVIWAELPEMNFDDDDDDDDDDRK